MTESKILLKLRILLESLKQKAPIDFAETTFMGSLSALVAAPHPDDFDAIGVSLKRFAAGGGKLHLAVFAGAWSGVEDSFCKPPSIAAKSRCREHEQLASCRFFGLSEDSVYFLRMREDSAGNIMDLEDNFQILNSLVKNIQPDLIFMPHGNDTNPDHRLARAMVARFNIPVLCNRDPKTIAMQDELITWFDKDEADWKAELLRCHKSQHQRNLNTRGHGFDERILKVNHLIAEKLGGKLPYAESFNIFV
jgi:LmbE family N-acetylglucosaminyl deacetylase